MIVHLELYRTGFSGFFVVAVVVFSYSLTFSLHSFRATSPDLSVGCRARRDSLGSCPRWGLKLLDLGKLSCGNTNQKVN